MAFNENATKKFDFQSFLLALFFVIALLASVYSAAGLRINEIMYNPYGSDDSEYIEIFQGPEEGCVNVTELRLFENNVSHSINFIDNVSFFCGYGVIVSDFNAFVLAYNAANSSSIAKSSFSLSNSGEFIALKNSTSTIDSVDYRNFVGFANGNGKSMEFFNNSWHESRVNGTPGAENSVGMSQELIVNLTFEENQTNETNQINFTNQTNQTSLVNQINQTNITQTTPTQTNTTQNSASIQTNQCNVAIGISAQDIFEDDKVKFYNTLSNTFSSNSYDFEIEYWIEDLEGNIVKNRATTANLQQKSWTAGQKSAYIIRNRLKWIDCNSTSPKINAEKVIVIRNNANNGAEENIVKNNTKQNQSFQNESWIMFSEIDDEISFNSSFEARLNIYKGNTLKSSVNAWVENKTAKLSAIEKFSIQQKFSENEMTAEITMKSIKACSPTQAMLVVDGLGIIARKNITIDYGGDCLLKQGSSITEKSLGVGNASKGVVVGPIIEENKLRSEGANVSAAYFSGTGQTESNLNNASVENIKKEAVTVYESPLEKSKKYVNFGIAGLFILLLVILWKSGKGIKISEINTSKTSEQKEKNERTRNKRKDFRRMDPCQGYLRDAWEAKRARRDNAEGICQADKGTGKENCNDR